MTKRKRTEKSKYKHISTGDHCTCAAYIAEIMCMRKAEKENKGSLPFKFWNKKPWDWTFKKQLFLANKLIKKYSEIIVVRAVNSEEFKKIFSLNNARAIAIIEKYSDIVQKEEQSQQKLEVTEQAQVRKKTYGKQTGINKLRSLDLNGKKDYEN
jgi:hypothetical protein